jgi:hypothetical protein
MRELHWHPNTDEWQYYIEARRAWACSWRRARPARSISRPATSASCLRHGPLRREHRNDTAALPRDIQERLLCRRVAQSVAGAHTAGARQRASEARPAIRGVASEGQGSGRAGVSESTRLDAMSRWGAAEPCATLIALNTSCAANRAIRFCFTRSGHCAHGPTRSLVFATRPFRSATPP